MEPRSPTLQAGSLPAEPQGKPNDCKGTASDKQGYTLFFSHAEENEVCLFLSHGTKVLPQSDCSKVLTKGTRQKLCKDWLSSGFSRQSPAKSMKFSQSDSTFQLNSNCTNAYTRRGWKKGSKATSTYYISIRERREKAGKSVPYREAQEDNYVLSLLLVIYYRGN